MKSDLLTDDPKMLPTAVGLLSVSCLKSPTPQTLQAFFTFRSYSTLQPLMGCFICQKKQDFLVYMQTQACRCQLWFCSFLISFFFEEKQKQRSNVRKSAALLNYMFSLINHQLAGLFTGFKDRYFLSKVKKKKENSFPAFIFLPPTYKFVSLEVISQAEITSECSCMVTFVLVLSRPLVESAQRP